MSTIGTGTGTTATFSGGTLYAVLSVSGGNNFARESIETTHLGTTNFRTFVPELLKDPGEITLECLFDAEVDPDTFVADGTATPVTETLTLAWKGTAKTWAATAFCTGASVGNVAVGSLMTITVTFKLSGTITTTE